MNYQHEHSSACISFSTLRFSYQLIDRQGRSEREGVPGVVVLG